MFLEQSFNRTCLIGYAVRRLQMPLSQSDADGNQPLCFFMILIKSTTLLE